MTQIPTNDFQKGAKYAFDWPGSAPHHLPENIHALEKFEAQGIKPGHDVRFNQNISSFTKEKMGNVDQLKADSQIDVNGHVTSGHTVQGIQGSFKPHRLGCPFPI